MQTFQQVKEIIQPLVGHSLIGGSVVFYLDLHNCELNINGDNIYAINIVCESNLERSIEGQSNGYSIRISNNLVCDETIFETERLFNVDFSSFEFLSLMLGKTVVSIDLYVSNIYSTGVKFIFDNGENLVIFNKDDDLLILINFDAQEDDFDPQRSKMIKLHSLRSL